MISLSFLTNYLLPPLGIGVEFPLLKASRGWNFEDARLAHYPVADETFSLPSAHTRLTEIFLWKPRLVYEIVRYPWPSAYHLDLKPSPPLPLSVAIPPPKKWFWRRSISLARRYMYCRYPKPIYSAWGAVGETVIHWVGQWARSFLSLQSCKLLAKYKTFTSLAVPYFHLKYPREKSIRLPQSQSS